MSGKKVKRTKHIPQRTCVGCHTVLPKQIMVRIVRQADRVIIDQTGKLAGRGAYLHKQRSCWEKGLRGSLAHALKITLSMEDLEAMQFYMQSLPDDDREEHNPMG